MIIERASEVLKESRKKIFDGADASSGFGFGELLVRCQVAQMIGVSLSDIVSGAFMYYHRAGILVGREDNKIIQGFKKSK